MIVANESVLLKEKGVLKMDAFKGSCLELDLLYFFIQNFVLKDFPLLSG